MNDYVNFKDPTQPIARHLVSGIPALDDASSLEIMKMTLCIGMMAQVGLYGMRVV